jgi:hypothetical protein
LQRSTATFQEPYLFDTRIGLSTERFLYTRYFYDWAEARAGGRIGLGYQFAFARGPIDQCRLPWQERRYSTRGCGTPEDQEMLGTNSSAASARHRP